MPGRPLYRTVLSCMNIEFHKYHGTGNDFIMINGFGHADLPSLDLVTVKGLCDRRFGIGADGLIIIEPSDQADFYMRYYNSDGNLSSMCGNGGRCAVHFARSLGIVEDICTFQASDGLHVGRVGDNEISIQMNTASPEQLENGDWRIDTGSPHYIRYTDHLEKEDIDSFGRAIRYSPDYQEEGINVNLVERVDPSHLKVATYERGVEAETYSCGTGVTACALVELFLSRQHEGEVYVMTKGGDLKVGLVHSPQGQSEVWLSGPAVEVYQGTFSLD